MTSEGGDSTSYWQASAPGVQWQRALPAERDVVVIGAGIVGSSAAYWAARAGLRPVLLDQHAPGAGATGRNGGFMTFGTAEGFSGTSQRIGEAATKTLFDLTLHSRALARSVVDDERIACEFAARGRLTLSLDAAEHEQHAADVAVLRGAGYDVELLDVAGVARLMHTPPGPRIAGAIFAPNDVTLHSLRLVNGIAAAAERHGAVTVAATVQSVREGGGAVRLETTAGTIEAGAVIIAANAWSSRLVPSLRGIITPVRGQMLAYAPLPPVFTTGIGAEYSETGEYWQQTSDGTIVLGGCRAAAPDRDVDTLALVPTAPVQHALEHVLPTLFPQLTGLTIARRWAGPMAFTPDYLPVVDRVPGVARAWFAGGFCGHGMPFGVRVGQALAEAVQHGALPADVAPLHLGRFR